MPSSPSATDISVAKTIHDQIGYRALFMLGAKNILGSATGLTFKIGRNDKGVTHVRVTLAFTDTYTIEFIKVRKFECKTLATVEGVYNDGLCQVIESNTGLRTSL